MIRLMSKAGTYQAVASFSAAKRGRGSGERWCRLDEHLRDSLIGSRLTWLGTLICVSALPVLADSISDESKLAAANTGFAFDLFRQIMQERPDANVFISPLSVSTVLQLMDTGAVGPTKQEMDRVLHTDDL